MLSSGNPLFFLIEQVYKSLSSRAFSSRGVIFEFTHFHNFMPNSCGHLPRHMRQSRWSRHSILFEGPPGSSCNENRCGNLGGAHSSCLAYPVLEKCAPIIHSEYSAICGGYPVCVSQHFAAVTLEVRLPTRPVDRINFAGFTIGYWELLCRSLPVLSVSEGCDSIYPG